jgi:dipeptidyl aminopeptidase/acylaminoacyl peptidase
MKATLTALTLLLLFLSSCKQPAKETARQPKQYSIEQFYVSERIGGGAWSHDASKLLVHSNKSGIMNLYEITVADASQKQMTSSTTESLYAIDYVPGTGHILYSADKGGNEIDHLYLLKDDSTTIDLTPAENEKANFFGWSLNKKSFFYISNKRNPQFFDLYQMNTSDWSPRMIYQNDNGYDISGISWDEKMLALKQSITTSESRLFLLDLSSKNLREVSDSAAKGNYDASGFSKDGKYFFFVTDAGKEFAYLAQYDLASGNRSTLLETNWDVMYSYLTENETYRITGLNEDGKNSLRITENATGKAVAFPDMPDGDVLAVAISDNEEWMRLTIGTSKAPSNIYAYHFQSKELKRLTNTLNPEISENDLVAAEVVRYPSFDGMEIPAIYYKPLAASPDKKVPALVWVHGGPGGQSRVSYFPLIQYLANHGYAVLAVNNRGSSGYGKSFYKMDDRNHGDKDLRDCLWGKKWLQSQPYIDSSKIGIIGGSYGGYMTMAAMTFYPDEFKAGVNIFGVTNWLRTLKSIPPYWESFRLALYAEMGDPATDSARLYNISPLFHADRIKNPVMVLQGANDPRVLQIESDEIVAAMKKNNIPVEYVIFPDEGHGFVKKENEIKGYGAIRQFLDMHLKGTAAADTSAVHP